MTRDDELERGRPWAGRANVAAAEDGGGAASPAGRGTRDRAAEGKLGAALIERDLLHEKIASLEADRPFGPQAQAMSRAISPVTGKPYGLAPVCRVWRLARSGVYRHREPPRPTPAATGAGRADAG